MKRNNVIEPIKQIKNDKTYIKNNLDTAEK